MVVEEVLLKGLKKEGFEIVKLDLMEDIETKKILKLIEKCKGKKGKWIMYVIEEESVNFGNEKWRGEWICCRGMEEETFRNESILKYLEQICKDREEEDNDEGS